MVSKFERKSNDNDDEILEYLDERENKLQIARKKRERKVKITITLIATCLVIIIIAVAVALSGKGNAGKKDDKETTKNQKETVQSTTQDELLSDDNSEISDLVQLYYDALLKGDSEAIKKYVDNTDAVNMNQIAATNKYIKKYENIECYVKKGLEDNAYVVFVYYEIKFKNIETLAPATDWLYVVKNKDTDMLYIHNGATTDDNIKKRVEELKKDSEISNLLKQTQNGLNDAIKKDKSLNELYKALSSGKE